MRKVTLSGKIDTVLAYLARTILWGSTKECRSIFLAANRRCTVSRGVIRLLDSRVACTGKSHGFC